MMANARFAGKVCWWVFILVWAACALGTTAASAESDHQILTLYNWEEYIGSNTLKDFEQETGITVKEVFFEDEEEIFGTIVSSPGEVDLFIASGFYIRELIAARMIEPLDIQSIPNMKHIGDAYRNPWFDPQQQFTVPYMVGTTGLIVNTKYVKNHTDSWQALFDPANKGRVAMLNNTYEVKAAALKTLGYSINSTDLDQLGQIRERLLRQKPLVKGYLDALDIREMMVKEQLWAAQIYSGDGLTAMDENENLVYVIPKEGAAIWFDNLAIPRGARNKDAAHAFIDFILKPEVNATIASELWSATPNVAAKDLMDPEVLESPYVYPSSDTLSRCELFNAEGSAANMFVQEMWGDLTVD